MNLSRHRFLATAAITALLLAACGGGGGAGDAPVNGNTGNANAGVLHVNGTITGFGSVIIDGQKFDDTQASVSIATDPAAPSSGALSDLKLGMHVDATVSNGQLTDVTVSAALVGEIGAIDLPNSAFTVYAQKVLVTTTGATPTVFEGATGLAGLAAGDVVEVHGTVDANKQIVATRIERKPKGDVKNGVRMGGLVNAIDATAKTFRLNDLTVDVSGATVLPAGQALAVGQIVSVFADKVPSAGVLVAKTVKVAGADDGSTVSLGGRIMVFNSLGDFTISGIKIDASNATVTGGTAADIVAGIIVSVEGPVSAGVLKATTLRVLKTSDDVKASLSGAVTDFVSVTGFKVRGTPVDASAATFSGGTAADLGNGASVKITGKVSGDVLKADTVVFQKPTVSAPTTLSGEMRDFEASTGVFKLVGASLKLGSSVEYVGGSAADLANGKRVQVTGTPGSDGVLLVSRVEFLGEVLQLSSVTGRLFDATASGFKLPGAAVSYGDSTVFSGGTAADLLNGVEVVVTGKIDPTSKVLAAATIAIHKSSEPTSTTVNVNGAITDFVSAAAFRIGGQKVDASQATFADGTAADLANGKRVEGSGVIAGPEGGRYVLLDKLHFLP